MKQRARMGRRNVIRPKPVQKIELSEKHSALRLALTILFLVVGAAAIAIGVASLFGGADSGWREIQVSSNQTNCGGDFSLLYRLGSEGISASAENRAVTAAYSSAAEKAYQLFTSDQEFEGVPNVAYLNSHPNEEVEVDKGLYRAFSQIQEAGDRSLYLGPVYAQYDDLFNCTDDSQTRDYDPYVNPEVAAEYAQAAEYANDRNHVDLELLGENRVRLKISEEYRSWAEEHFDGGYLDFFWMKNAFIADYLADALAEGGYVHGYLSSYDGFVRNLDESGESYSLSLYDRVGKEICPAGSMEYAGPAALVYLRDYPVSSRDSWRYYQYQNGEIRTSFLDAADGLCKSARGDLVCYAKEGGCAQVLLKMIPVYIADSFREEQIGALLEQGVYSVYCKDRKILYNDPEVKFSGLYQDEEIRYEAELLK